VQKRERKRVEREDMSSQTEGEVAGAEESDMALEWKELVIGRKRPRVGLHFSYLHILWR
jgi:hypothetical protein